MNNPIRNKHSNLRTRLQWLSRTPFHPQWLLPAQEIAAALKNCNGTVLDIGSADRWLNSAISPEAYYIAMDYPATAIKMYGTRPDVFADAHELPFADECIDTVACFEVLEHVAKPDVVISQIARVLRPGGTACFSMPFLYPIHDAPHDFQRWTAHRWTHILGEAGLHVESIKPTNHSLYAAATLTSLALAGPLQTTGRLSWHLAWRGPALLFLTLALNLGAWILARIWPSWEAITTSYQVIARKPE